VTRDGDSYTIDIRLPGHGRTGLGDLALVEVDAGAPYAVEANGLPVILPVAGSITVTTRWTFECDPSAVDFAEPVVPGGAVPYEAVYLATEDGVLVHADVTQWLMEARFQVCSAE
jgi:hypothetical protein